MRLLANSRLAESKSVIPPLCNCPEMLFSASSKAKMFIETFSKSYNLDDSSILIFILITRVFPLAAFPSRTNLKYNNIPIIPKLVMKVKTHVDASKTSGLDYTP